MTEEGRCRSCGATMTSTRAAEVVADSYRWQASELLRERNALRDALQEIWDTVPSVYPKGGTVLDEDHPQLRRHAAALHRGRELLETLWERGNDAMKELGI